MSSQKRTELRFLSRARRRLRVRESALRETRFVADAHLGGLAHLLRMTGFDTLYDNHFRDDEIERLADTQGRIVLTRPAVEAGESLGYLPGDINDKLAPYLRPLNDALNERLGGKRVKQLMTEGAIEIAPIAYMRGRTLNNAFIVIDEAQNCTYGQIKMLLTRLGWHSTMVVTGDPDQSDLLDGLSGLSDIARRLEPIAEIAVIRLGDRDIVRHPLVADMLTVL